MRSLSLSLFAAIALVAPVFAQAPPVKACAPCNCGCVTSGSCLCKNCNTHTADPTSPDYIPPKLNGSAPPYPGKSDYASTTKSAIDNFLPHVTFVGCPITPVVGACLCSVPTLDGYAAPCVIVSAPDAGKLFWVKTLKPGEPITLPTKGLVDCASGKCTPSYFPDAAPTTSGCATCGTATTSGGCASCGTSAPARRGLFGLRR